MNNENIIEIINDNYLIEIEDVQYSLYVDNILVSDYIYAENKPQINSVTLLGNKSSDELCLASSSDLLLKEDKANKITLLNADVTDLQFPSAKCIYDELLQKSDVDLSNLSSVGEAHFANPNLSNLSSEAEAKFANKVNVNADNFNEDGKSLLSAMGMPSDNYIQLSFTLNNQYTAVANGYIQFDFMPNSSGYLLFSTSDYRIVYAASNGIDLAFLVPISSGKTFSFGSDITWTGGSYRKGLRFIYAQGEIEE